MKLTVKCAILTVFSALALPAIAAAQDMATDRPLREVNVTAGSTPGWVPTVDLEVRAIAAWNEYYALLDAEDYPQAYQMLGDGLRDQWPLAKFESDQREGRETNGARLSSSRIKITWTNGGSSVPKPGIYAAIDASAQFERTDRHCGYTMLYSPAEDDDFVILRIESTFLTKTAAEQISEQHSPLQMQLLWRMLARNCPNYSPPPLPASIKDGIDFGSVAASRSAIESVEGIEQQEENGWSVMIDEANLTIWSFSPEGDPMHPSVVKRWVETDESGKPKKRLALLCEAEKTRCDALFDEMAFKNGITPRSF